jgi:hypothetical protein
MVLLSKNIYQKFVGDKKILSELERSSPTLTISIPELPNNAFNATVWNTSTEIPSIAIRLENTNDVPIISSDGSENVMDAKYVPGFPVIVLKESERVIAESDQSFKNSKTKEFKNNRGQKYKFISDNFDSKSNRNKRIIGTNEIDPKLITAYNTYAGSDGWQRDQIYYNITPSQNRGEFDNNFEETVTSFSMIGDPWAAYYKVADQSDDPHSENYRGNSSQPHWTDGAFEFKIISLVNAKSGVGPTIETYFSVPPSQLFNLHYRQASHNWFGKDKYELDNVTFASDQISLNLPIIKWNWENYAVAIKMSFEEVDVSTTETSTNVHSTKFAGNFEINAAVSKKVGLKFGASLAIDNSQTHVRVISLVNDKLGDVIVDFGDNVVNSVSGNSVDIKDYYIGNYARFNIVPKKVF